MLEELEHAQIFCLFACCEKHESICILLQVAVILYLLMLMGQLYTCVMHYPQAWPKKLSSPKGDQA